MSKKDILIVGQGLAGTTLAFELIERGCSVKIVDDTHATASSLVGIAVINPVTGRRYAKSWNIDELLPHAIEFYSGIRKQLNNQYLSAATVYQTLSDSRIEEIWMLRAEDPDFHNYLDKEIFTFSMPGFQTLRCAQIKNAFHLQISDLIHDSAKWFTEQGILLSELFESEELHISSDIIQYKQHTYNHIVFCEGHRIIQNPLFSWLEILPMKGEFLICRIPGPGLTQHLKTGISIIPLPEPELYWCGATYDRYNQNPAPTETARNDIMKQIEAIVSAPFTIESHGVGIRATTRDRRPYIGTHPDYDRVHLVAGLGTKGASLAPYCATLLADALVNQEEIPSEVDILRHS